MNGKGVKLQDYFVCLLFKMVLFSMSLVFSPEVKLPLRAERAIYMSQVH